MVVAIIVIAVLLLIGLIYILIRNSIIGSRNRVDESWSGIDVQLKRRHDLVPNLVETVQGLRDRTSARPSRRSPRRAPRRCRRMARPRRAPPRGC